MGPRDLGLLGSLASDANLVITARCCDALGSEQDLDPLVDKGFADDRG